MKKFEKLRNTKFVQGAIARKNAVAASLAGAVGSLLAHPAFAGLDMTGVTVDTADFMAIAGLLVTALIAFFGVRKGLGLLGK